MRRRNLGVTWLGLIGLTAIVFSACSSNEGVTPLMKAAIANDVSEIQRLLSTGAEIDDRSKYDWTALVFAIQRGNEESAVSLIKAGADPNVVTKRVPPGFMASNGGYFVTTPFREALREGNLKVAHLLLDSGSQVGADDVKLAGRHGDAKLFERLKTLDGIDFDSPETLGAALGTAANKGNLKAINWLLANGASPNGFDRSRPPLVEAISATEPEAVRLLLARGADVNFVYQPYTTQPDNLSSQLSASLQMHVQDFEGHLDIVKQLVAAGADRSFRYNGETPLDRAIRDRDETLASIAKRDESPAEQSVSKRLQGYLAHENAVIEILKD